MAAAAIAGKEKLKGVQACPVCLDYARNSSALAGSTWKAQLVTPSCHQTLDIHAACTFQVSTQDRRWQPHPRVILEHDTGEVPVYEEQWGVAVRRLSGATLLIQLVCAQLRHA